MSSLAVKRLVVIVISLILGFVIGWLIVGPAPFSVFSLLPLVSSIEVPQGRTIAEYGIQYFLWTSVPLGIVVMIWLDKFFDTHILPD